MANWTCAAAKNLPIDDSSAWNGAEAKASVFEWAGFDGDSPDSQKARRAFLIFDSEKPDLRGSYHLPFAQVKSGTLTALASGIRAAASRLPQMDGPSDSVKSDARAVIDAYEKQFSTQSAAGDEADERLVCAFPAPITRLYTSADQPAGSVTEPWVSAVKKMAGDPSVFTEHPPYLFRAHISNNKVDGYYTRMHRSTLENFAADATRGVSFQNSHRETELGFGRSFNGEYLGSESNGTARTEADFYTIPGLNINGVNTDDLILGMRAGLVKDVSVGFFGGFFRCATCQRRLFTGDCRHIPGFRYDRDGKPTDDPDAAVSVAWVHDAHLAETSAVYDGACPGAAILKARQLSAAGHLRPEAAAILEDRYRIRLPDSQHRWPGADVEPPEEIEMPDDPKPIPESPAPTASGPALRQLMEAAGLNPGESDEHNLRDLTEAVKKLPELAKERERLAVLADDGRQYRAHLIDEAIREGVRAYGAEKFPAETQRAQLENASLDFIRSQIDLWKPLGDAQFAAGRQSADTGEPEPKASPRPDVHPSAYAG